MQTRNLYGPLEIEYVEATDCPLTAHKHTFFEMVYILEGTGIQCINQNKLPYSPEKLFLLMPRDFHSFEVHSCTKFLFIRFTDSYLKTQNRESLQKLEFIFHHHNHLPGCIVKNKTDKPLVKSLVEALMREQINRQHLHHELTEQIINTLITVVVRNISFIIEPEKTTSGQGQESLEIIHYIHRHIYSPVDLKAEKIASHFNRSPTYISEYFKKLTGESLQQYIIHHKLKLIETRLLYSEMRMNEIAFEFGFTDESHLTKIFKKYKGVSPSTYRKQMSGAKN